MFKIFRSNSMDTGNKIIIILLILIAIAALVCGFLFISNGLGNSEDTELQDILQQIATHYHVRVVYTDEDVRHLRLHFVWDTTLPLSGVVALFNHFDRIHLSITDNEQTIIVE